MQSMSDILSLFCASTWPSLHVSENQELRVQIQLVICVALSLATVGFCQEEIYPQKIVHKDQITTVIEQQS